MRTELGRGWTTGLPLSFIAFKYLPAHRDIYVLRTIAASVRTAKVALCNGHMTACPPTDAQVDDLHRLIQGSALNDPLSTKACCCVAAYSCGREGPPVVRMVAFRFSRNTGVYCIAPSASGALFCFPESLLPAELRRV